MDQIQHKYVNIRGLKLHIAEIGTETGPAVVFLHGFPEIWYSWRYQMIALADAGFRAIAPDHRGYGLSEQPLEPEKGCFKDLVDDLLAILDVFHIPKVAQFRGKIGRFGDLTAQTAVGIMNPGYFLNPRFYYQEGFEFSDNIRSGVTKVIERLAPNVTFAIEATREAFLIGKDFGVRPASEFALLHPERVIGVVTLGLPLIPPPFPRQHLSKGFYMLRWQEPGRAEADFGRFDVKTVIRNIYILFSGSELQIAREDQEIMDLVDPSTPLPDWFSEQDLKVYATLYEKSGFRFPLQVPYRSLEQRMVINDLKVKVPALLIIGEKDYSMKFPGREDYIRSGTVKEYVPDLEIEFLPEGTHFVQEQLPGRVNKLILTFLSKHCGSKTD